MTNEQKYKTAEERFNAFYKKCCSCGVTICGHIKVINCLNNWLAIEAKEEKPEPCPFCNGKTEIVSCNGGIQVRCTHCGYTSEGYREGKENEAIAAHNRVCRAVETAAKQSVTNGNRLGNAAELRECLKEAIREKCPFTRMSCKHGEPCEYVCGTDKWRKALEGAE